jgi:kinesin family protein 5
MFITKLSCFFVVSTSLLCVLTESNQELIMAQGGISLLSMTAANADDPQTLRMVAGAIANLCGNGK